MRCSPRRNSTMWNFERTAQTPAAAASPGSFRGTHADARCGVPLGHVADPGIEHVADIDLAGRIPALPAAVLDRLVGEVAAANLHPLGPFARQADMQAVVDLQVVG